MAEATGHTKTNNGKHYQSLEEISGTTIAHFLHLDTLCGCGPFQPAFLQHFATPVVFTAHAGSLAAIFFCALTYFNGILTTIEKQFQLSSSEVAALSVLNDATSLSLVIFVTYYGHKSHRPRWIATGYIFIAVSFIFCAMPHFLSEPIDTQSLLTGGTEVAEQSSSKSTGVCGIDSNIAPLGQFVNFAQNSSDPCVEESKKTGIGPVKWLLIGQIIMGWGSSPLFALTVSYIDDAVEPHKFTSYTAFLFIAALLGPIVGYFLTSKATSLYVDFDRISANQIPNIKQHDPRWIGAWWLFFPLFSILMFVAALPMFMYPKVMKPSSVESCGVDHLCVDAEKADDKHVDPGICLAIKRLLTNSSLVLMYLGATAETALGVISGTFQVKYYQTQFGTSPATAATLMALMFGILQIFIGCRESPVAGINFPYSNNGAIPTDQPSGVTTTETYNPILQLESTCNSDCSCPNEIFQPVCGSDGVSYISPCHAGCTEMTSNNDSTVDEYTNCACISAKRHDESFVDDFDDTAVSGLCRDHCDATKQLTILLAVGVVTAFVMSLTFNPLMFVIFRLVDAEDRSIALGFQSVITKCLGYFPAPIIMGMLINSTCTLWQYTCGNRGSCWLYDILAYRYLFVGTIVVLKFVSLICHSAVYFSIKSAKVDEDKIEMQDKNGNPTAV
ncbi:solute carrier organic anion transporter family member 2A1-like [Amphiura filiformis]|uniref:solute carrier organic anion transporter family member 2A1-like n=1 Tax=Amphiura filiformis TaxID=82378 RepID=UPI003B228DDC